MTNKSKTLYIYLMSCSVKGIYKIGVSKLPDNREKTLSHSCDKSVQLKGAYSHAYAYKIEALLHFIYREKRVRGEWFSLSDTDIKNILENNLDYSLYKNITKSWFDDWHELSLNGICDVLCCWAFKTLNKKLYNPDSATFHCDYQKIKVNSNEELIASIILQNAKKTLKRGEPSFFRMYFTSD